MRLWKENEDVSEMNQTGQPKQGKKAGKKTALAAIGAVAIVLLGGYAVLCTQVNEEAILPKTTVNGVDLSGMTKEEAAAALSEDFQTRRANAAVKVAVDGQDYTIQVGDTLTLDCSAVAEDITAVNRGAFLTRGAALLKNMVSGSHKNFFPSVTDNEKLEQNIQTSGLMEIDTTVQTTYQVNPQTKDLDISKGITGHSVDEAALTESIYAAVAADDYETVIDCPMLTGTVNELDWDALQKDICRSASDATLSLSDDRRSYTIVESVTSVDLDMESAKTSFDEAEEGTVVAVPLVYTEPEITTQNLKDNLFVDVLSSYETPVRGSDGRRSNVRLAGQKINGIILLPGDSFSYNNTLGERTAENGFYPAPAYLYGETIMEYGGGICQVSSTLYSATLYANLQIDERHNHTYASSYIGLGMDATVSWEGPDFQFTNNQKYPIKIDAGMWDGNASVQILGTKTTTNRVEIRSDVLDTTNFSTKTKSDSSMEEGKTMTEQHGVNGYRVQTYRIIKDENGNVLSEAKESYSDYEPETEIIVVGTKKKVVEKPKVDKTKKDKTSKDKDKTSSSNKKPSSTETA